MLKGTEIRVGKDFDYDATVKDLRGEFVPPKPPTDDATRKYTSDFITVCSAGVIHNKTR